MVYNDDDIIILSCCSKHQVINLSCDICIKTQQSFTGKRLNDEFKKYRPCNNCGFNFANTNNCPNCFLKRENNTI